MSRSVVTISSVFTGRVSPTQSPETSSLPPIDFLLPPCSVLSASLVLVTVSRLPCSSAGSMPMARHLVWQQYSTMQYSIVQYSTAQYSTAQYSTVQHSTWCSGSGCRSWWRGLPRSSGRPSCSASAPSSSPSSQCAGKTPGRSSSSGLKGRVLDIPSI